MWTASEWSCQAKGAVYVPFNVARTWRRSVGFAAGAAAAEHAGVDLAKLAGWDIVVAKDASPSEAYAGRGVSLDLRPGERRSSLPMVTAPDRADRHVLIGPSKSLADSPVGFDAAAMGTGRDCGSSFASNQIAIAGGRPRGTLYGVYTFLEDYLGVRFLTADHTHVPKCRAGRSSARRSLLSPAARDALELLRRDQPRSPFAARLRINTVTDDAKHGGKTGIRSSATALPPDPLVASTARSIPSTTAWSTASGCRRWETTPTTPSRA